MPAHRTKRQFAGDAAQRPITAYFGASSTSASQSSPSLSASAVPSDFRPLPPTPVQADLLNVGMRVRKSIPEGYQTGKEPSGLSLFSNNAKIIPRAAGPVAPMPTVASARVTPASQSAELQPFCGIHKVGGLVLPEARSQQLTTPALGDVPGLSLSQNSIPSDTDDVSAWGGRAARKRPMHEDDEEEEGNRILVFDDGDATAADMAGRTIAIPRRRKADVLAAEARAEEGRVSGDDFEEAEFLDAGVYEDVEMHGGN